MKLSPKIGFVLGLLVIAPILVASFHPSVALADAGGRVDPIIPDISIVPCGNKGQAMCTFEDFVGLAKRIIDISLVYLAIPLAILSFAAAGFRYLIAFGNESEAAKVHSMVTSTVKGVFLAFFAWLIVSTLFSFFVQDAFNPFK